MEQYPIPQFIEEEGRIVFFITFKQFFFILAAGAICFVLYYVLPLFLFIIAAVIIAIIIFILAFVKINGAPVTDVLLNSFGFLTGAKNYMWKKKESPFPFKPIKRTKIKEIEEGPVLKTQQSQLKKTKTQVELRIK